MALFDSIEKLGRAIFESSFPVANDAPELAEIRLRVLEAAKVRCHRAGSIRVFGYNLIRVKLLGVPEAQAGAFQGGFLAEFLGRAVRETLARSSTRFPENLRVEIGTTPRLPGRDEGWIAVEMENDNAEAALPAQSPPRPQRMARLVVLRGSATRNELPLTKARINIGRTVDVYHADGPARRNDLAFVEDNEINRTVSREHAHIIAHKKSGQYRIFNDRWYKGVNCGLWILRDGLSQPVHRGDRGFALQPGDEIHAGRAVIKFVPR